VNTCLIAASLSLIIGEDDDGAASVTACLLSYITSGIEQRASDVSTAIEALLPDDRVKFPLDVAAAAAAEREAQPGAPVEHHDCHPVLRPKGEQRCVGRGRDTFNVRAHASADVEQQENIHRHFLCCEVPDRLFPALFVEDKVLGSQARNRTVIAIDHLHIDADEGDIAAEYHFGLVGRRGI
jgi:hypothetical protein